MWQFYNRVDCFEAGKTIHKKVAAYHQATRRQAITEEIESYVGECSAPLSWAHETGELRRTGSPPQAIRLRIIGSGGGSRICCYATCLAPAKLPTSARTSADGFELDYPRLAVGSKCPIRLAIVHTSRPSAL